MRELPAVRPLAIPAAILAIAAIAHLVGPPMPESLARASSSSGRMPCSRLRWRSRRVRRGRTFVIAASPALRVRRAATLSGRGGVHGARLPRPINASRAGPARARALPRGVRVGPTSHLRGAADLRHLQDGSCAARQHAAALAADAARRADLLRRRVAAAMWRAPGPSTRRCRSGARARSSRFYIAVEWVGSAHVYASFMAAAGAILIVALVQESHRLAFHDPLTELPGRRALEERLSNSTAATSSRWSTSTTSSNSTAATSATRC